MRIANPEAEIAEFPNQISWPEALENRAIVPADPAVYAITTRTPFARLITMSRVLYIGKTGQLGGDNDTARLYAYRYQPTHSHGGRIRMLAQRVIDEGHDLILRWQVVGTVQEAADAEFALLEAFIEVGIELPPFNRKG